MRNTLSCGKCNATQLWVIDRVQHRHSQYGESVLPMPVTAIVIPPEELPFWTLRVSPGPTRVEVGTFEVWICKQCGFTEWYANDVNDRLAELAQRPESGVRSVEPSNNRGPFR